MDSPVDVGGFAEPRKILSQYALPSLEQLSVHPRSDFPTKSSSTNLPNIWHNRYAFHFVYTNPQVNCKFSA